MGPHLSFKLGNVIRSHLPTGVMVIIIIISCQLGRNRKPTQRKALDSDAEVINSLVRDVKVGSVSVDAQTDMNDYRRERNVVNKPKTL